MSTLTSKFKIFKDLNLVIECHKGILNLNNYTNFKEKLNRNPDFIPNMNFLIYFNNVNFEASVEDINKFADYMKDKSKILGNRKVAVITNTPNQVVSTTIYKSIMDELKQPYEIFSTNERALNYLNVDDNSFEKVTNTLNQLNNS